MINDYGQLQAINKDLSGLEDEETKENQTELEAVIDHIESITTRLEIEEVKVHGYHHYQKTYIKKI